MHFDNIVFMEVLMTNIFYCFVENDSFAAILFRL